MHDPLRPESPPAAQPGSPEALDHGCVCSVLLNRLPDGGQGFVNPLCPLHGPVAAEPERPDA